MIKIFCRFYSEARQLLCQLFYNKSRGDKRALLSFTACFLSFSLIIFGRVGLVLQVLFIVGISTEMLHILRIWVNLVHGCPLFVFPRIRLSSGLKLLVYGRWYMSMVYCYFMALCDWQWHKLPYLNENVNFFSGSALKYGLINCMLYCYLGIPKVCVGYS